MIIKKNSLSIYFTAGYPVLNATMPILRALQEHGASLIEIGIPYSDPLSDGPVIQKSSSRAIENGMTVPELFFQLQNMRREISIPVILMGYLNPILQFGFENFCKRASAIGISGLIIPDLPSHEYQLTFKRVIKKYGLHFIFLVTPETRGDRIMLLDSLSSGFLYAVSGSAITGSSIGPEQMQGFLEKLVCFPLKNPVLAGFGIKNKAGFRAACTRVRGAIIGSAFIETLSAEKNINETTAGFMKSILG